MNLNNYLQQLIDFAGNAELVTALGNILLGVGIALLFCCLTLIVLLKIVKRSFNRANGMEYGEADLENPFVLSQISECKESEQPVDGRSIPAANTETAYAHENVAEVQQDLSEKNDSIRKSGSGKFKDKKKSRKKKMMLEGLLKLEQNRIMGDKKIAEEILA